MNNVALHTLQGKLKLVDEDRGASQKRLSGFIAWKKGETDELGLDSPNVGPTQIDLFLFMLCNAFFITSLATHLNFQ